MWIKWKYNDHGWPDFQELEIPDDLDGCETVKEYLRGRDDLGIPTWSERFMGCRIKWEKLDLSASETKARRISKLKAKILYYKTAMSSAQAELDRLADKDCPSCGFLMTDNKCTNSRCVDHYN